MDGISVAASILGLVGAAAKVTICLNALVTSVKTAPKLAQSVLFEVSDVSICLSQLQRLLLGMERGSESRERLIMVEQLVVVLSNCVSIFSELEEILESLDLMGGTPITKMKIARWLRRQHSISTLLIRLQASKQSLTLIVTTLNCTSVGEAENAMNELKALIKQVLESNQVLAERMANLELQHSAYALSIASNSTQQAKNYHGQSRTTLRQLKPVSDDGETSTDSSFPDADDTGEDQDSESIVTVGRIGPTTSETLTAVDGFAFEQDLFASRPYARAINRRPCWSATSSVVPTMGWSYLSGLSLADVSEVSMLSLPLLPLELWNGDRYVTAKNDLEDSAADKKQQIKASVARPKSMTTFEHQAASPWLFGKIFEGWNSFCGNATDSNIILSANTVLLGVPFSGKRTIHRHSQLFHGNRFSELDRIKARNSIIHNLIETFMVVWKNVQHSEIGDSPLRDVEDAYWTLVSFNEKKDAYDFRLYRALLRLWAHDSLRYEIQHGKGLVLNENIPWFIEHLESLFLDTRLLSDEFLLRQARETSESYHQCQSVDIDGISCELLAARETRFLPKDWSSRFNSADAVIFVVPLSAYCQDQPASASLNMMKQQIRFFECLTRLGSVQSLPILLLLNKTDVLEHLITTKPISDYFEDYTGGANWFDALTFFADKFAESDHRVVYNLVIYGTCAVEEDCIRGLFKGLDNRFFRYNGTKSGNRLGGRVIIFNPVAKPSADKMLRRHNEERFSKELYVSRSPRDGPPFSFSLRPE